MKTITMTLDEYNADIKKAMEDAEVEKYKPLVDLVRKITAVESYASAHFSQSGSCLPDRIAYRPYHNWTKDEIIDRLRQSMVQIGEFDGILDRKERKEHT